MDPYHLQRFARTWLPGKCDAWSEIYVISPRTPKEVFSTSFVDFEPIYGAWARSMIGLQAVAGATARLLCLDNSIVLDMRDSNHLVSRIIVAGEDIAALRIGGVQCRILHVSAVEGIANVSTARGLAVFVETGEDLPHQSREELFNQVCKLLRTTDVQLSMRSDPYFIDARFPWFYPFWPTAPMPEEASHLRHGTFLCISFPLSGRSPCGSGK
jgi:hypothetical protein